jgi:hypothetical protein
MLPRAGEVGQESGRGLTARAGFYFLYYYFWFCRLCSKVITAHHDYELPRYRKEREWVRAVRGPVYWQ